VFFRKGAYIGKKIREKGGVFIERKSIENNEKPINAGLLRLCHLGHMKVRFR